MIVAVTSLPRLPRSPLAIPEGVRGLEVRLDLDEGWQAVLADPEAFAAKLAAFEGMTRIVTCRRADDAGRFEGREDERRRALELAAKAADYVDLELSTDLSLHPEKIIRSYHDTHGTPWDIIDIFQALRAAGGTLFKIVPTACTLADNLKIRDLLQASVIPLIGFCMGEYGLPSRILALAWGSRLTYASLHGEELAPGMPDAATLAGLYRAHALTRGVRVFGVTGEHVGHSLSPWLHNRAIRESGRHAVYVPLAARDPHDFLRFAEELPIAGASVTVPFKEKLLSACAATDEAARAVSAVNTLVLEPGRVDGFNTDVEGLLEDLKAHLAGCAIRSALVLGAGGAARATVEALRRAGAKAVIVLARRFAQATALCRDFGVSAAATLGDVPAGVDLVVATTPCGMRGAALEELPVDWPGLRRKLAENALVYDLVYEPELTPLLAMAQADGFRTANGLGMLLRQGERQARCFGYLAADGAFVEPRRGSANLLWLVGFRASGKSTLAPLLATALGVSAFDLDAMVEARAGCDIRAMFREFGEAEFRRREEAELRLLVARRRPLLREGEKLPSVFQGVVATGGGVVENPELGEIMRTNGRVVWLDAPLAQLIARLEADTTRPSLSGRPPAEETPELLARRAPLYAAAAHYTLRTEEDTPEALAGEILSWLAKSAASR